MTLLMKAILPMINTIMVRLYPGTSATSEMKKAFSIAVNVLDAVACRCNGAERMTVRSGAIDIATKRSPTSAAPAPALAAKKS